MTGRPPDPLFEDYAHDDDGDSAKHRSSQLHRQLRRSVASAGFRGPEDDRSRRGVGSLRGDLWEQQRRRLVLRKQLQEQQLQLLQLELVGNTPSEKNWKAIGIALLMIASILSLITVSVVIAEPTRHETKLAEPLSFTESMNWLRHLKMLTYQWLKFQDNDMLIYRNASTGDLLKLILSQRNGSLQPEIFMLGKDFSEGRIDQFVASPDCQILLVPTRVERVFRHSTRAQYKLIRVPPSPSGKINEAVLCPKLGCYNAKDLVKLQLAVWGPSGSFIAFVYDNNIYYADDPFNMEPVKITDNGGDSAVTNGISTWVYEEEILETSTALWVSPGNQRIAYLRFNDSLTGRYEMPMFGSSDNMYLQHQTIRYPKAGVPKAPISNVTAMVYDVRSSQTLTLVRPSAIPEEHYITVVRWLDANKILLGWADRSQTLGFLTVCSLPSASCSLIYTESMPSGWVELLKQTMTEPIIEPESQAIYTVLHNSGYRRIARMRTDRFNELQWVTPAKYDVSDILRLDPVRRHLYFLSCREETDTCDPTKMHVHRISTAGSEPFANCLTCSSVRSPHSATTAAPEEEGENCEFNRATFSPSGRHFLHECLGPEPFQYFLRLNDYTGGYPVVQSLERNLKFKALIAKRRMPRPVFKRLLLRNETTEKGRADPLEVYAKLLLPAQLNESHITEYPLLLKVYGGPTVQTVTRRFEFGWQHYMASALHFITASVDGRGTGNRGSDYLFAIKNNFARVELQDQMDGLKALKALQYVNESSVAVFGWSYGGFLTLHMLGHPYNVNNTYFSCGVAVAAVTDFSYYNSGYTERYLGVKTESNAEVYRRTNVAQLAGNFWNKDLFLAHGTGDDNVHYQNTAQLVKALVEEYIDFEFMTYPDDSHGLVSSQPHVFHRITAFLIDTFNQTSERRRLLKGLTHDVCRPWVRHC